MKKALLYFGYWMTLFVACYIGGGGIGSHKFDEFSNNLMISDMICERNLGSKEFIQTYGDLSEDVYIEAYKNNFQPDTQNIWTYTSQVGIQRYLYCALDKILPFSGTTKLLIMGLLNAGLLALILTIIVRYMVSYIGRFPGVIMAGFLFFAVALLRFGTNLYWVGWILFLPMALSILNTDHIEKKSITRILLISFIGNLLKNLCYFEFASAIMVATVIPFLFAAIKENLNFRKGIKIFFASSVGAIGGFVGALIWKFVLLIKYNHSIETAINQFMIPIKMRVTGTDNIDSFSDTILTSKSASTMEVIKYYLNAHDIGIGSFTVGNNILICLIAVCIVLAFIILVKRYKEERTLLALAVCTVLSFVGPLSWMILAKPHAYIHRSQCAVLWWIPLFFYGIPLCVHTFLIISHKISTVIRIKHA